LATGRRYVLEVYRLGRDIFLQFRADTIRILLASAASLSCQVFALLLLYVYLKALEGNAPVLGLASRTSPALFTIVACATLALLVGYSLLEYRANLAILRVSRHYQSLGTASAIALSSRLPHWFAVGNDPHISARHLRQILSVDVHHRSRMARVLMLAIIPAARLVLCVAALLYLNPQFTALILFAVGVPVLGLYSVGRKVADTITIRETGSAPVFQKQRELLESSWERDTAFAADDLTWETTLGEPDSRYRQYFRRLRAKSYGTFLVNAANTVGIMVLVVALGIWILEEQQGNWSLWLTYLVVLRYFLASLRSTAQTLVKSTRFLRQTQRFTAYIAAAMLAVSAPDPRAVPCPDHVIRAYKGTTEITGDDDDDDDDDLDDD
jgi:ABC-type multidrug transport system fused ATPase/permease subunit